MPTGVYLPTFVCNVLFSAKLQYALLWLLPALASSCFSRSQLPNKCLFKWVTPFLLMWTSEKNEHLQRNEEERKCVFLVMACLILHSLRWIKKSHYYSMPLFYLKGGKLPSSQFSSITALLQYIAFYALRFHQLQTIRKQTLKQNELEALERTWNIKMRHSFLKCTHHVWCFIKKKLCTQRVFILIQGYMLVLRFNLAF